MTLSAIKVKEVSKIYKLYDKPVERLKETFHPLRKKYHQEFHALKNISFEIYKGETVGIIGKNGSGKSTLLKMITGVLTPSNGEITVNGNVSALLELGAGFNPEFTGIENIYLNGAVLGFSKEEMDTKLNGILNFAEIGEFIHQPVKMYSSGMFARLAFAVAINVNPGILIVDEALAVGDVRFQAKCFKKFKELKESGVTILFVSHDVFSIRNFCDRAIWINDGMLIHVGDTFDVTSSYVEFMNNNTDSIIVNKETSINTIREEKRSIFNPINRWGSHTGIIQAAEIIDSNNQATDLLELGGFFSVIVSVNIPEKINLDSLSIAFSIKNPAGQDLIVSTTFDEITNPNLVKKKGCIVDVKFTLKNYLNQGEYILIVAVEDRSNPAPEYYDYIEGAAYFKVSTEKQLFGLIHVPVEQSFSYHK